MPSLHSRHLNTYAMAQAASGDLNAAVETTKQGIVVAEAEGQQQLAALLRQQLARYAQAIGR